MKKNFCFKLIILISLVVIFIEIFTPIGVFAFEEQYIQKDQFDDESSSQFNLGNHQGRFISKFI